MKRLAALLCAWAALTSASPPAPVALDLILSDTLPPRLSDFRFFVGGEPNARVVGYTLNTQLFSDYTDKQRFMFVPPGERASLRADGDHLHFPVGSALIKTFGYGGKPIETRVLVKRASGWVALPYVWEGDDAVLKRGGKRLLASFTHNGKPRQISYAVPNQNQCKGCHVSGEEIFPIGPRLRNLDQDDQLHRLAAAGVIVPNRARDTPFPRFEDASAPLDARARAYLDVNCAHCHSRDGPASNSGLYLGYDEADRVARGVGKRPVAAGRGSGGFDFAIEPGHPERSILTYRMKTIEPGLAMPELGRATVHEEAVAMLDAWIREMPAEPAAR